MKFKILVLSCIIVGIFSCKKDTVILEPGALKLALKYRVDGDSLQFDTIKYLNAAGNKYSLYHLEYYISGVSFYKSDGSSFVSNSVFYINAQKSVTNSLLVGNIPQGSYSSISLLIGLDSNTNKTNFLPNILDNINMAWPDAMGGGYHFMKMEGYFKDKADVKQDGYAMHLGRNNNLVTINLSFPLIITKDVQTKTLTMNINEWYKNPSNYDFETDGNYSMGLPNAMSKLAQNGKDVFTIK